MDSFKLNKMLRSERYKGPDENEFKANFGSHLSGCREKYPRDIWENLYILCLHHWEFDTAVQSPLKTWLRSKGILEYNAVKMYNRKSPPETDSCSVLVPFTNICRRDYLPFIRPALTDLSIPDEETVLFTSRLKCADVYDGQEIGDHPVLYEEDLIDFGTYRRARRDYRALEPHIESLCSEYDLSWRDRQATILFFKRYYLNKHIFLTVLERTSPDVIYTIHFHTTRGYFAALREYEQSPNVSTVFVQHGAFSEGINHQFVGADWGLLWGEYFQDILDSKQHVPVPENRAVVGNPKIAELRARYSTTVDTDTKPLITYASTPVDHSTDALRMVAETLEARDDIRVIYKPHPSAPRDKFRKLLDEGLLSEQQIRPSADTYELIVDSRVVLGTESSVLPEAIALDVPVLQLLPERCNTDWDEYGLRGVSKPTALNEEITELCTNNAYWAECLQEAKQLTNVLYSHDEEASNKISAVIENLI
jgi:hypothetical protein